MRRWNAYLGQPVLIDEDRVVVSEPVSDLPGVPESTVQREFTPQTAAATVR
jgi:hypothetical protein